MKTYTATLTLVQYSRAEVFITAHSLKDARRKADEIGADEVDGWNPVDGDVSVGSVTLLSGRAARSPTQFQHFSFSRSGRTFANARHLPFNSVKGQLKFFTPKL
jgi:hypothetical protein